MDHFDDLPGRGRNHVTDERAVAAFRSLMANSDHFILQRTDERDYGTDCEIEALIDGSPSNFRVPIQLKGSERPLASDGSLTIQIRRTNLNYLLAQPHSLFVAYHVLSDRLLVEPVESVLRDYDHGGKNWTRQDNLSVHFKMPLTRSYLQGLAALATASARVARRQRIDQIAAHPTDLPAMLRKTTPVLHVPNDRRAAAEILLHLYEQGSDAVISASFEQFEAVLGAGGMGPAYMAEINIGIAEKPASPDRIRAGIAHFTDRLDDGIHQPGSLHYTIGNAHAALGDQASAKASYQAAAGDFEFMAVPKMAAQCLKNLGTSIEHLGNKEIAAHFYRAALEFDRDLPEAHYALGIYHHREGHFDEALEHYDAIVFTDRELGTDAAVSGRRLNALFNLGQVREAFRTINRLLSEAEREPWIWGWCGRQVAAFGRTSVETARHAVVFWQRYLKAHPAVSPARAEYLLTKLYLRAEGEDIGVDRSGFSAEFEQHIAHVAPEEAALPWDRLGHWAQDDGDWAGAERCYRMAFNLAGGHYGYCLGTALNFLGRFDEALPILLAQAEAIQPDAMSWFQVAVAQENLGRPDAAVENYRKALMLDPDYDLAMFNMAGVLWNSGRHEEAALVFRTAVAQFPDHDLAAKAQEDLSFLFDG